MANLGGVTVDAADVAEGWRPLTTEQSATADTLLNRAAAILLSQSPGLLDRLTAGTTPPEAVEQVLINAVRRAMLPGLVNPEGAKKMSRSGDDYSESYEWDANMLAAGLYFTPHELASLAGARNRRRGKAFTIDTTPRY